MRRQRLDLTGQEMMTEDKVTLRLNFVSQYVMKDPLKAMEIKGFEEAAVYSASINTAGICRDNEVDEPLRTKQEIGAFVLERLAVRSGEYGVAFLSAGVKDIILPGEVKDIMNTVLLAEKSAG